MGRVLNDRQFMEDFAGTLIYNRNDFLVSQIFFSISDDLPISVLSTFFSSNFFAKFRDIALVSS